MARGGEDAGDHVDGGFDKGVDHGAARGVPGGVGEERGGEEGNEAEGASYDAAGVRLALVLLQSWAEGRKNSQRGREEGEYQADFLGPDNVQLGEDGPGEDEHGDVGDEAGHAVQLVEEHDVAAVAVLEVDGLRPEVAEGAAYGEGEDEGDDALEDEDGADDEDDAPVGGHLEDLVVEEEGGELGEHDGGRVGEFEDFGELEPGLEGGYGDGGDVVAYAADLGHYWGESVCGVCMWSLKGPGFGSDTGIFQVHSVSMLLMWLGFGTVSPAAYSPAHVAREYVEATYISP